MLVYVSLVVIHTLYMSFKKFVHKFTRIKHDGIFPCTHFIHTYLTFKIRGRVQTTWTEFWAILTPLPPMWTLLLNSCY